MKKRNWLYLCFIVLLCTAGWYGYQKMTDDTYEGMSIIPEEHKDIPLYPGLEPQRNDYVMKGDSWREVAAFYEKQMPKHGWTLKMKHSSLDDKDPTNDWSGAFYDWTKKGFNGVLSISTGYNQMENVTDVMFDQTPILVSTTWIEDIPESICIHKDSLRSECEKVTDPDQIKAIVHFINDAFDSKEKAPDDYKESRIDFGGLNVYIGYKEDELIYLWSEKGTKTMKPEPEFLSLTKISF
jgi:hypothetical protein